MKQFFATLAAILVAAAIILLVKGCVESQDRLAALRRHTELLKQQVDQLRKDNQEAEERARNP